MIYGLSYVAAALVFLAMDAIWLSTMSTRLYRPALGDLLLPNFNLPAAGAFYLIYIAGIVVFGISPAIKSGAWTTALVYGALFGFFAYATYDLTNQATLRGWSFKVTIYDMCWGAFVSGVSAAAGFWIASAVMRAIGARS